MQLNPNQERVVTRIGATIDFLRRCQAARAAGNPVAFATDPAWLVNMAINRRAGWPDDPGFLRGSAMPVNGRYPKRASDMAWTELRRLAQAVNTPRLIVRRQGCGCQDRKVLARIEHRFFDEECAA